MALLALLVGCNKTTTISGTVTLNGEPIQKGAISFRSADGRGPSIGGMIENGQYSIEKAVPGSRIAVISAIDEGKVIASRDEAMKLIEEAKAEGKQPFEAMRVDLVPPTAKGNSETVEIAPGSQTLDFAISTTQNP